MKNVFTTTILATILGAGLAAGMAGAAHAATENVRISIGSYNLNNLPFPLALGLGYFKDEGLNVTSQNFAKGGSSTLQALIAGSTDIAVGFYDHTIQMQAKGKHIVAVVLQANNSGLVLAGLNDTRFDPAKPETIKGMKVGITSPGSSSDFFLQYYLTRHGMTKNDVSVIGVGSGQTAVEALMHHQIDLLVNYDPAATILQDSGKAKILIDARTPEGATSVFGSQYPTSVLYATDSYIKAHPEVVQKVVNAEVKALHYIHTHNASEIVAQLPKSFVSGNHATYVAAVAHAKGIFSPDGMFDPKDLETPLKVLKAFNQSVQAHNVDLTQTYTNTFAKKAGEKLAETK
ncbi:MAG: ABC transporter substrate-binding protein [Paracoccaceae bacterium]|nr:ABC transporter substrate-binding protein [Paracoccaceae bacterium]